MLGQKYHLTKLNVIKAGASIWIIFHGGMNLKKSKNTLYYWWGLSRASKHVFIPLVCVQSLLLISFTHSRFYL